MAGQILLYLTMTVAALLDVSRPLLPDAAVARVALELLEKAGAADGMEHAAFIVRSSTGSLELLPWLDRGFYAARWTGAMPDGVLAIIHTHPRQRPTPSAQDRAEAKRLGMPLYVVTRGALCVAAPTSSVYCANRVPWLLRGATEEDLVLDWSERVIGTS